MQYKNYKEKLLHLPILLLSSITLLAITGFIVLWSAAGGNIHPWAYKQMISFAIFLPISIIIALIDLRLIFRLSNIFYFFTLILLSAVEVLGYNAMGAKRWVDLGFLRLQPSEPVKFAIVLMLARYIHQLPEDAILKTRSLLVPLMAALVPIALVIKQPDLGTGMLTLFVTAAIFFTAGVQIWKFAALFFGGLACAPIIWSMMYDYQRARVLVFLEPDKEPLGSGYNIIQSKIAIGSGGFFGKGLTYGTQSHLNFLPEYQTDFIFAFLSEELGFIGGIFLLCLYIIVIGLCLSISVNSKSLFGKLIASGVGSIFFSHVFINMGMVMGMLPAVGIPLPFISYGGTMMASLLIGFGLVMNVHVHSNVRIH